MAVRVFVVKSDWLADEGQRLDASAYAAGGLEARDHIRAGPWPWRPLGEIAQLFNGPRFGRHYVGDPTRGIPFLSSTDILLADLSRVPRLSRSRTPFLGSLVVRRGWTLISCSGTIGRTAYVRDEIDGMASSQHVMRAVPHEEQVRPGYLFAFLTSVLGQAMIRQRTYGTVVQHIEPHHIKDLPVPLIEDRYQERVHELVSEAAVARSEAAGLLDEVIGWFDAQVGEPRFRSEHARALGVVYSSRLAGRLDAFHHIGWSAEARINGDRLGEFAEVFRPGFIKRIFTERGTPFVSGIDVYQTRPTSRSRIMVAEAKRASALLAPTQVLVQRSGQRYGLLGGPAYVGGRLDGWAASEDLMRITATNRTDAARIFGFLRSDVGRRSILRMSYGTSIPHFNQEQLANIRVPRLPPDLGEKAARALELRERADDAEDRAIFEIERWLV
jgi:type I restriction enzyme S subunit